MGEILPYSHACSGQDSPSIFTLCACARGKAIGLPGCLSVVVVVVVGTKVARSRVLGICAHCKHKQSVDISEKLVYTSFELLKKAYYYKSCIFCQHACGLSTTPTNATALAQAQCWKGSSSHKTALQSVHMLKWLQSARGMYSTSFSFIILLCRNV